MFHLPEALIHQLLSISVLDLLKGLLALLRPILEPLSPPMAIGNTGFLVGSADWVPLGPSPLPMLSLLGELAPFELEPPAPPLDATLSAQKLAVCRRCIRSEPARLNACGSVIRRKRFGDSTLRMSTEHGSA